MIKYFLSFMAIVLIANQAVAQVPSKDLALLIHERDSLFVRYSYYDAQKSSFWGRQSRQDLRNVIETLKGLIKKDTEIVQAIRIKGVTKQNHLNTKNMDGLHRIYELENQLSAANSRANLIRKELKLLESEREIQWSYRLKLHIWALCSFIVVIVMLALMIKQRLQIIALRKDLPSSDY